MATQPPRPLAVLVTRLAPGACATRLQGVIAPPRAGLLARSRAPDPNRPVTGDASSAGFAIFVPRRGAKDAMHSMAQGRFVPIEGGTRVEVAFGLPRNLVTLTRVRLVFAAAAPAVVLAGALVLAHRGGGAGVWPLLAAVGAWAVLGSAAVALSAWLGARRRRDEDAVLYDLLCRVLEASPPTAPLPSPPFRSPPTGAPLGPATHLSRAVLVAPAPPSACAARLRAACASPLDGLGAGSDPRPLAGRVTERGFSVRSRRAYSTLFSTRARGRFQATGDGRTRVLLSFGVRNPFWPMAAVMAFGACAELVAVACVGVSNVAAPGLFVATLVLFAGGAVGLALLGKLFRPSDADVLAGMVAEVLGATAEESRAQVTEAAR